MSYAKHFSNAAQSGIFVGEKVRPDQVENNTGGFVFKITPLQWFTRFLVLGTEGGTYYQSEKRITLQARTRIKEMVPLMGKEMLEILYDVSDKGRAPRNSPAVAALALIASYGDPPTRKAAIDIMPKVARTATDMFAFVEIVKAESGFGSMKKTGIANWYLGKSAEQIAYQMIKYRQRNGWTHADVLRLSHPKTSDVEKNALFRFAISLAKGSREYSGGLESVKVFLSLNASTPMAEVISLLKEHKFPWEALPTEFLSKPKIWEHLLPNMLPEAMLRNLGRLASIGMLGARSEWESLVINTFSDSEKLKKYRVHPVKLLIAKSVFDAGRGVKGGLSWKPNARISEGLEDAFYSSFESLPKTNTRYLIANDVSRSMIDQTIAGTFLSAAQGAAAMNLLFLKQGMDAVSMGFSDEFTDLEFNKNTSMSAALEKIGRLPFSSTDCSLPFKWALQEKVPTDVFIVITDNETNTGTHPYQAMEQYRKKMGINAKLIVMGMTATGFSIADPNDSGMLDVVGFDGNVPAVIDEFVSL